MLIILFILVEQPVFACSVPVFRYALERWPADYYEAVLIHRGQMTEAQKKLLNELRQEDSETDALLNLHLMEADIASATDEKVKSLLMSEELPEILPVLALWYPWQKGQAPPVWQGRFNSSTVAALLQSPARKKLAERLIEGQTTVWVFLKSGNSDKDKAALQLLEKELEAAAQELKEAAESMPEDLSTPEVTYEFSILPVSRSDPNEHMLITLLMSSEPDLKEYSNEPIVFPVFGRGRALYALVGEGISSDNIRETIYFLTGPCSCQIKMLNPGVDLLLAENWDAAVMKFYEEFYETYNELPELTGVMPEAPVDANMQIQESVPQTQAKGIEDAMAARVSEPDNELTTGIENADEQVVEKQQKFLGLGLLGTTGIMLAVILLIVVLGTIAISPRRKGQL
jgi:hypothetical protein